MRFGRFVKSPDPSISFALPPSRATGGQKAGLEARSNAGGLPPEIAFLSNYGVPLATLIAAARLARQQGVSPDRVLLAHGDVDEDFFYRSLARHLGVAFINEPVRLLDGAAEHYRQTIRSGLVSFEGPAGESVLAAPRGKALVSLIRALRRGAVPRPRLAITTPSQLSRCIRHAAHRRIAAEASFGLLSADAQLCAHGGANIYQRLTAGISGLLFALSFVIPSLWIARIWPVAIGLLFLAATVFKLVMSAAALGAPRTSVQPLEDHQLPTYTILIALYKEARVVRRLVRALERIDYPRAKLEIKFLLEEDDHETRRALEAAALAPIYEIIIAPSGQPRTKPRALNIALPLAQGEFCVVFDAEDVPDPQQLRRAAEKFAQAPARLACLQARLAIENVEDSWLTRLFAIEYAALFQIQNIGLADFNLPLPVSGSSNHFRTQALRAIHGWDAWNVTEDADIGLRLARFGYCVSVLDSTTYEEAPVSLKAWFGQRRRWFKGWLQSLVTITRSPFALAKEIGLVRSLAVGLLFFGLLFGPLFWVPSIILAAAALFSKGLLSPSDVSGVCLATLWASVSLLGAPSLIWYALLGMRRQKLLHLWPALALLLPYYCLHTAAAWMALYDLFWQPFHWHKTEHGVSRGTQRQREPARERALV